MKKLILILCIFFLSNLPANAIKIGLYDGVFEAAVGTSQQGVILDKKTHAILQTTKPKKAYKIYPMGSSIGIVVNGKRQNLHN
ncbi:hypothetical protein IKA92_03205, partial [bacterium]|nr:hypothetical protein [bacterium]